MEIQHPIDIKQNGYLVLLGRTEIEQLGKEKSVK